MLKVSRLDRPVIWLLMVVFFFQGEDGIRDYKVTGVQTCALPICAKTRPACLATGGPAAPRVASAGALSVRSMKSAPSWLSPLTASSAASRRPPWRASEALSVASRRRRFMVTGSARPAPTGGGLLKVRGASIVAGSARPAHIVGGLPKVRGVSIVAGSARPAHIVGGLLE